MRGDGLQMDDDFVWRGGGEGQAVDEVMNGVLQTAETLLEHLSNAYSERLHWFSLPFVLSAA